MHVETQSRSDSEIAGATIEALVRAGVRMLEPHSSSPRLDTELLLAHVLGSNRAALFAHREEMVPAGTAEAFLRTIRARQTGQPVAQLTGCREFWSLPFAITADVLVPRPETEILVERALARLAPAGTLLDLGTGSGAIAVAVASERPQCDVLATDASADALAIARRNARAANCAHVRFAAGDWYGALARERFDVIACNPPYLSDEELAAAGTELAFEPRGALTAGADALAALRIVVGGAPAHLLAGGWLLVEHAPGQDGAVRSLMRECGLVEVATSADLAGRPRVTEGRNPAPIGSTGT
jgi:release factor glutamine methyltransferase